ncbi:MAG: inverse autotransporter beta domain-containing protein, partial [Desulfovibrio sp.]|nr:inverse autotransporter beta domain-containing protein [Desulfovibrio sp.]
MRSGRAFICPAAIILLLAGLCLPAFFSAVSRLPGEGVRIIVAREAPEPEKAATSAAPPATAREAAGTARSASTAGTAAQPGENAAPPFMTSAGGFRPDRNPFGEHFRLFDYAGLASGGDDAPAAGSPRPLRVTGKGDGATARKAPEPVKAATSAAPPAAAPEAAGTARSASTAGAAAQPGRKSPLPSPAASSLRDVLLKQAAAFVGVPAPANSGMGTDEGLGFHQDGTARRAGTDFDGRRAAAFMTSGLGYDPQNPDSVFRPGYNPFTGEYFRFFDYTPARRNASQLMLLGGGTQDAAGSPFLSRGLSWASGLANSMAESLLAGLADGTQARLNFLVNVDGEVSGEGDVLFPLYDGKHTTVFTQMGARSMAVNSGEAAGQTRWIGNFGLGQRWYPFARDEKDAGDLMLGYNIFLDNDFTRSHQRGGAGLELQADWLKLSSNYYWPLSSWKRSRDFDGNFVEERPARGWDLRAKAYLPFYRNVALTGSYTQWYGEHVGMFGPDRLEKDPRVWSYGIEFTPFPLLTAFVRQRQTERGRTDTEFGLNFVYRFGMDEREQASHAKVAELRTVSGSRHDFVDRENKIILEYRAKRDYRIEYLGRAGDNLFRFRVTKTFGGYAAGATVTVNTGGTWLALRDAPPSSGGFLARVAAAIRAFVDGLVSARTAHAGVSSKQYVTDGRGEFLVRLDPASLPSDGRVTVTARIGNSEASFTLLGTPAAYTLEMTSATPALPLTQNAAANVVFTVTQGGSPVGAGVSVTFAANPNFSNLPTAAQTTNSSGQFTVTYLKALASGSQTLSATVQGQAVTLSVSVAPAPTTFTLEASPSSLTQNAPTPVTFTLKQGGVAVGAGESLTFAASGDFNVLPTGATTDGSGQIAVSVTALTIGSQTLSATVDGQSVSVAFTVSPAPATYTLEASPSSLTQNA